MTTSRLDQGHVERVQVQPAQLNAKAGTVEFFLVNAGTWSFADSSGKVIAKSELVLAGDSRAFSIDYLSAASYQVYGDLPRHKESGVVATLAVS